MKVLQVIDKLNIGGAERLFVDLSNVLSNQKGISVEVLTFLGNGPLDSQLDHSIKKNIFLRTKKFNLIEYYKLSSILKKFDIIHVHMRHNYRYIFLVMKLFSVKSKIILHDHYGSILVDQQVPFLLNSILKPQYYIGVSKDLCSWAETFLKLDRLKNITLLPNFVVKENISKEEIKPNGIVVVGNIKPIKNQMFAIQLASSLNTNLSIVGQIQDSNYYEELKDKIVELNLQENVKFHHDIKNIQKFIVNFEIGLMTSISESGPLVTIEYLSQNLPFVSNNVGEVSQLLSKKIPEFYCSSFDKNLWIDKIKNVKNSPYDLSKIYQAHFSTQIYINKCLKLYKNILNAY